jgi:hypothetical protein
MGFVKTRLDIKNLLWIATMEFLAYHGSVFVQGQGRANRNRWLKRFAPGRLEKRQVQGFRMICGNSSEDEPQMRRLAR